MPRVVMKGLILSRVTIVPLIQPTTAPAARAAATASPIGRWAVRTRAATSPQKAIAEPTDMSNAPQTMTMVMPMTINPSDEAPSRIARADSRPRKRGLSEPKTATARTTDARIVNSRMLEAASGGRGQAMGWERHYSHQPGASRQRHAGSIRA